MQTLVGIDFGAKKAGTTVLAFLTLHPDPKLQLFQSLKNQDADIFLKKTLSQVAQNQTLICIDAPLSLPAYYSGKLEAGAPKDYFYRKGDKILGAMSALFLGGLTARAIQLKDWAQEKGHQTIEGYPAAVAKHLALFDLKYKKDKAFLNKNLNRILEAFTLEGIILSSQDLADTIENWHQIDALLALLTALRFKNGVAIAHGQAEEGQIWV
jgi:predicted nuclease with RNAse H fold